MFLCEYTALEAGMLSLACLTSKVKIRIAGADADADVDRTSATHVIDRTIRSCAQNAVVVSVLTLRDTKHARLLALVVHCSYPVEQWHGRMNKRRATSPEAARGLSRKCAARTCSTCGR